MKKVLITGVTGQDGAYLSKLLLSKGYLVYGLSPRRSTDSNVRLRHLGVLGHDFFYSTIGDITDQSQIFSIIENIKPDEIYNLAAQSFVKASFDAPSSTITINTIGVSNILEAMRKHCPDAKFYQASTSEMFGLVDVDKQNEHTPFKPRSPYGVSKVASHYMVDNYRAAYGLHASCGILFNHESPLRGLEFVTRKITDGVANIVSGKKDDLLLGNLNAIRDWGHAEDYVYGMWLMLQQDSPSDYVLATGEGNTVGEFCRLAFEHVGLNMGDYVRYDERFARPSDIPLLLGDPRKAEFGLGWKRKHTFKSLLKDMLEFDLSLQYSEYRKKEKFVLNKYPSELEDNTL